MTRFLDSDAPGLVIRTVRRDAIDGSFQMHVAHGRIFPSRLCLSFADRGRHGCAGEPDQSPGMERSNAPSQRCLTAVLGGCLRLKVKAGAFRFRRPRSSQLGSPTGSLSASWLQNRSGLTGCIRRGPARREGSRAAMKDPVMRLGRLTGRAVDRQHVLRAGRHCNDAIHRGPKDDMVARLGKRLSPTRRTVR